MQKSKTLYSPAMSLQSVFVLVTFLLTVEGNWKKQLKGELTYLCTQLQGIQSLVTGKAGLTAEVVQFLVAQALRMSYSYLSR